MKKDDHLERCQIILSDFKETKRFGTNYWTLQRVIHCNARSDCTGRFKSIIILMSVITLLSFSFCGFVQYYENDICLQCILRHQKIKIDKSKLLNLVGIKRSTFDTLHKKMEKIVPTLESGKTANELFSYMVIVLLRSVVIV